MKDDLCLAMEDADGVTQKDAAHARVDELMLGYAVERDNDDRQCALEDLFTDLLHWADIEGIDGLGALNSAQMHHSFETDDPDDDDDEDEDEDEDEDDEAGLPRGATYERQLLPTEVPEGHIALVLEITNEYELYPGEITHAVVVAPVPPQADTDARTDWEYKHIHAVTGVGHTDGDSWYDVKVLESSHPDVIPVGATFKFGY